MLKNISNLGTVLNKSEQQQVKGGVRGSQPWEMCYESDQPCICDAADSSGHDSDTHPDCNTHGG